MKVFNLDEFLKIKEFNEKLLNVEKKIEMYEKIKKDLKNEYRIFDIEIKRYRKKFWKEMLTPEDYFLNN